MPLTARLLKIRRHEASLAEGSDLGIFKAEA
jgi:hypothetical protein